MNLLEREDALTLIMQYRHIHEAPVDSMSYERLTRTGNLGVDRYVIFVSLLLSSKTTDILTLAAIENLRSLPDGLTVDSVLATDPTVLLQCIRGVSLFNRKLADLMKCTRRLSLEFGGEIPSTFQALTSFSGIGQKMALIILHSAWNM